MRPHPLIPSPRRTLATLAALLISSALSLGFAPLSTDLGLGKDVSALTLAEKPCDLAKVSAASPVSKASAASPAVEASTSSPAVQTSSASNASSAHGVPVASTSKPLGKAATGSHSQQQGSCSGVRPGAVVTTDDGALCTSNFVFTDGIHHYIGTAGHCVLGGPQVSSGQLEAVQQTWSDGGPAARDAEGKRIGAYVYALRQDPLDFAVIRLDHGVPFSPQMCAWGGPTGINNDRSGGPVTLRFYGNGIGISDAMPARSAVALDMSDPTEVIAIGVGVPIAIPGDSGAPVTSADGRAVGTIVSDVVGLSTIGRGVISIPRIGPQIAAAEGPNALGVDLQLVKEDGSLQDVGR